MKTARKRAQEKHSSIGLSQAGIAAVPPRHTRTAERYTQRSDRQDVFGEKAKSRLRGASQEGVNRIEWESDNGPAVQEDSSYEDPGLMSRRGSELEGSQSSGDEWSLSGSHPGPMAGHYYSDSYSYS